MVFIGRRTPPSGWPAGRYRGSVTMVRVGENGPIEALRKIEVDLR